MCACMALVGQQQTRQGEQNVLGGGNPKRVHVCVCKGVQPVIAASVFSVHVCNVVVKTTPWLVGGKQATAAFSAGGLIICTTIGPDTLLCLISCAVALRCLGWEPSSLVVCTVRRARQEHVMGAGARQSNCSRSDASVGVFD